MAWLTRSSKFTLLTVALAFSLAVNLPAQVQAQASSSLGRELIEKIPNHWESYLSEYDPPSDDGNGTPSDLGRPGGTRGPGGTKATKCQKSNLKNPVALVPSSGMGTTVAEYPTFSWYMPCIESASGLYLKFVLKDAYEKEVYSVKYPLPDTVNHGIRSITLPTFVNLPPLEVNQNYDWQVRLIDPGDSSNNIYIDGGVKRVEEAPNLAERLKQATPQQRVVIYANDRLWYETLTTLVELRRQRPNDENLAEAWNKLLDSVGLGAIAEKALFEHASTTHN
ncbi:MULTISPECIES: DUF928 domain-containing protein [Moorena]|uniref:DUF928 domain-containing protein n=1 Tax=Moorena producens 3L TaxID=489825 RepID=F4Y0X0_9CYAN|nr:MULTISPECIES: DUF928 domain-containing protein [Moorena]NEQ12949.1 DUF928 domain-containing protein [Moorena sp. SIO3E2]EGJ29481.1 protein of unknown function, DUF928 [Moorena producens 3L]NEP31828.1 DUF928 domain-containing protein [Moorena sp. SIO3B2]NEP70193.1 DUF928 domain-containing protein [Moorena sp. SIO3A5]NEQ08502.1 DUF928 domain-containing protein [Moorena sp. SIO4E2]